MICPAFETYTPQFATRMLGSTHVTGNYQPRKHIEIKGLVAHVVHDSQTT